MTPHGVHMIGFGGPLTAHAFKHTTSDLLSTSLPRFHPCTCFPPSGVLQDNKLYMG